MNQLAILASEKRDQMFRVKGRPIFEKVAFVEIYIFEISRN